MFVDPKDFVKGGDSNGVAVTVNAAEVKGYQGNPFVVTSGNKETQLDRTTYEMQTMIDPGDPDKKREINHMYPGIYAFDSDVYLDLPEGYIGMLKPTVRMAESGCTVEGFFRPGYKGLITGQLNVNGGEFFFEPGEDIAELYVQRVGE